MGFDPIVTGDRRRAAVHRMKIPFCRRSRLQEIRFRPASGSERQASAPLSNLESSGLVETLVLAHSSKTDTLGCIMFGPFWSVWCKTALAEVGVSLP